jgi:hypothetical protein
VTEKLRQHVKAGDIMPFPATNMEVIEAGDHVIPFDGNLIVPNPSASFRCSLEIRSLSIANGRDLGKWALFVQKFVG